MSRVTAELLVGLPTSAREVATQGAGTTDGRREPPRNDGGGRPPPLQKDMVALPSGGDPAAAADRREPDTTAEEEASTRPGGVQAAAGQKTVRGVKAATGCKVPELPPETKACMEPDGKSNCRKKGNKVDPANSHLNLKDSGCLAFVDNSLAFSNYLEGHIDILQAT